VDDYCITLFITLPWNILLWFLSKDCNPPHSDFSCFNMSLSNNFTISPSGTIPVKKDKKMKWSGSEIQFEKLKLSAFFLTFKHNKLLAFFLGGCSF
jgi:hypothetical protein